MGHNGTTGHNGTAEKNLEDGAATACTFMVLCRSFAMTVLRNAECVAVVHTVSDDIEIFAPS